MKKLVLGLTVASVLGLTGCGDGPAEPVSPDGVPGSGTVAGVAITKATFAPGNSDIPLPNDLLFGGTTDLTLNIPVESEANLADPKVSLSGLDGWSGIAPFAISFNNADGTDLNPATIIPGSTIKVFETNVYRPEALPGTGIPVPTGPVTSLVRELTPGVDFVATYAGPLTAAVIPLKPLTPQASYMVIVTTGVLDANGNNISADFQYSIAKQVNPIPADAGSTAALEPVRQLVNAMEIASGLNRDTIALSYQFTVQSMGQVVATNKAFYIDYPFSLGQLPATSFSSLFTDTTPFTGLGYADLYKGDVALNYYLGVPGTVNDPSFLNGYFLGASMIPNPGFDPEQPISETNPPLIANPFAGGTTTYANPLVQPTSLETAPLMVSVPNGSRGCVKPAAGYPVMIFQHGITADRTNILGIADTMANFPLCTAVIAMDMPLHGIDANNPVHLGLQAASGGFIGLFEGYTAGGLRERTFGVDLKDNTTGAPGPDGNADSSGSYTINLTSMRTSRDNNRQAVLDLLTLEKAIPAMDVDGDDNVAGPDFDVSKVSFFGHSWGGIVGNMFLQHSDFTSVAVMANSGGNLSGMIDGSITFGTPVKAGLAAMGILEGTPDFAAFLFALQTVIDDGDAIHSNAINVSRNIPTLMLQVADDPVVPNFVASSPTAGTTPQAAMLGLVNVAAENPGDFVQGDRLFSRLNAGGHSTVLTPNDADGNPTLLNVTQEMQTHIATFIGSGGAGVTVVDPTLLD